MNSIFKGIILSCVIGFLVACSLEPISKGRQVWIRIEEGGKHASIHLAPIAILSGSPTPAPSVVSGFDCLGVNVTGPGIADTSKNPDPNAATIFDRLLRRESYCSYRGMVFGPIASNFSTPQEINFVVSPGLRLIQLVGMKERNGSNSCQVEFNPSVPRAVDPSGRPLEGDVYELGRAVADLVQDQSITIQTDWNSLQSSNQISRLVNCNNTSSLPSPSPSPLMMLLSPTQMAGVGAVTNVAMSGHTCVTTGGSIQCKGGNFSGQLGIGTTTNMTAFSPVLVSGTQVAVGGGYSCALLSGGTVQC